MIGKHPRPHHKPFATRIWRCSSQWERIVNRKPRYYQCNIYDKQSKEGKHADEERTRAKAKHALEKYMFYFERFMDHDRGMKLTVTEEQDCFSKVFQIFIMMVLNGFDIFMIINV